MSGKLPKAVIRAVLGMGTMLDVDGGAGLK
jgi:hypothetical protein